MAPDPSGSKAGDVCPAVTEHTYPTHRDTYVAGHTNQDSSHSPNLLLSLAGQDGSAPVKRHIKYQKNSHGCCSSQDLGSWSAQDIQTPEATVPLQLLGSQDRLHWAGHGQTHGPATFLHTTDPFIPLTPVLSVLPKSPDLVPFIKSYSIPNCFSPASHNTPQTLPAASLVPEICSYSPRHICQFQASLGATVPGGQSQSCPMSLTDSMWTCLHYTSHYLPY